MRGNAPGSAATSRTIRGIRPGSNSRPAPAAGWAIACVSSSWVGTEIGTTFSLMIAPNSGSERGRSKWSARIVTTTLTRLRSSTDDGGEAGEEPATRFVVVGEQEQLLELVDHQQQLAVVVGKDLLADPQQTSDRRRSGPPRSPSGRSTATREERGFQLLERVRPREHVGDQDRSLPDADRRLDLREETGTDEARLAAPRWSDDRREPICTSLVDELADEIVPTEEVVRIGLRERTEPLVRIAHLDRHRRVGRG